MGHFRLPALPRRRPRVEICTRGLRASKPAFLCLLGAICTLRDGGRLSTTAHRPRTNRKLVSGCRTRAIETRLTFLSWTMTVPHPATPHTKTPASTSLSAFAASLRGNRWHQRKANPSVLSTEYCYINNCRDLAQIQEECSFPDGMDTARCRTWSEDDGVMQPQSSTRLRDSQPEPSVSDAPGVWFFLASRPSHMT